MCNGFGGRAVCSPGVCLLQGGGIAVSGPTRGAGIAVLGTAGGRWCCGVLVSRGVLVFVVFGLQFSVDIADFGCWYCGFGSYWTEVVSRYLGYCGLLVFVVFGLLLDVDIALIRLLSDAGTAVREFLLGRWFYHTWP